MNEAQRRRIREYLDSPHHIEDEDLLEMLDDAVYDAILFQATKINNAGIDAQLDFLTKGV